MEDSTLFIVCMWCYVLSTSHALYDYKQGPRNANGVPNMAVDLKVPSPEKLRAFGTAMEGDAMEHIFNMNKNWLNATTDSDPSREHCLLEGDVVVPCGGEEAQAGRVRRNALRDRSMRWPNGIVPYEIDNRFAYDTRQRIIEAMARYRGITCIQFVARTTEQDYISIFPGSGCWSLVGRVGGVQQLSLGTGCTTNLGTIIHELMHAIGFQHEQTRADRDSYIYIYFQNIIRGLEYNFDKYDLNFIDHLGTNYDYLSVMHYHSTAFSANGRPTIVARDSSISLDYRSDFSSNDIDKINILYECGTGGGDETGPTIPDEECVDKNQYCPDWAAAGYCDRNPQWMHANCPISCEICDPNTGTGGGNEECVDTHDNCANWAQRGECDINPSWMLPNCPVSCEQCDTTDENCKDQNDYCDDWARSNQCTVNPSYMLQFCPRACGQCSGGLMQTCEDYNDNCAIWAANDQCRANPGYMNYQCRKSCQLCTASSPMELRPQVKCQDSSRYCEIYVDRGMCDTKATYMNLACPHSCGMCPEQLQAGGNGASGRWSLGHWLAVVESCVLARIFILQ